MAQGLLYDFYGELLTEHQRKIYEAAVYNDLSLSEIAQEEGISRQGVHDLVRRCDKLLEGYENKLHLVERFVTLKSSVSSQMPLLQLLSAFNFTVTALRVLSGKACQSVQTAYRLCSSHMLL
mgnify:CR=1 FL=1